MSIYAVYNKNQDMYHLFVGKEKLSRCERYSHWPTDSRKKSNSHVSLVDISTRDVNGKICSACLRNIGYVPDGIDFLIDSGNNMVGDYAALLKYLQVGQDKQAVKDAAQERVEE